MLHAGGKFGGGGYKVSGGLHGVGVSVVNALSKPLEVEIDRDGERHGCRFDDGGEPDAAADRQSDLAPDGRTGTTVRFWPDPAVFDETDFRARTLTERFQMMAFLNAGLASVHRPATTRRRPRRPGADTQCRVPLRGRHPRLRAPRQRHQGGVVQRRRLLQQDEEADGEVEIAFQWNTGYNTDGIHSFANGITTIEGGMHEEGFKKSLTNTVNRYARDEGPEGEGRATSRARTSARASPPSSR